jgi:hypothetical protein
VAHSFSRLTKILIADRPGGRHPRQLEEREDQTRQTTTAKVRPDEGKAARFLPRRSQLACSTARCGRGARFIVAEDTPKGQSWRHNTRNPRNVV